MKPDFWIVTPFNLVFDLTLGLFVLLLVIAALLLRGKSEQTKTAVLITACALTTAGFLAYKYFLSVDEEFRVANAAMGGFNWWSELPLHMCNVNMLLLPVGLWRKSRPIQSFCFFLGPLGAMMALAMPSAGFSGYPLYLPRMLGFYLIHCMIIIDGLSLAAFGLYRPRFRDLPRTVLTALVISFAIFLFNLLLRASGLCPKANYFYSVETEGNPVLELFHRWVPLPFLYLIPCLLILVPYMLILTAPFALADRLREKKTVTV